MNRPDFDQQAQALSEAFEAFNRTTQSMEEAYRRLEGRIQALDAELAEKNQELAVTMDYLNSILESISDGVLAVDVEGRLTTFNRAASLILGFDGESLQKKPFAEVFGRDFHPSDDESPGELRASDGSTRLVLERDAPLADKTGTVIGAVKVFQDISEIEELRERVRRKDRLAALGEMAATVAHEIRNPLGGIRGFASLLARDLDETDPRKRLVEKVIEGTKSLDKVVNDLLEYTRPIELRQRVISCADIVEPTIGFLDPGERAIAFTCSIPPDLRVHADPDRLRQVLLNVLLNAVQSIEGQGAVRVSATAESGGVAIVVADDGCGMTPEQLGRAFMPFYTTKDKGTGLGLAAAAKIVEGHGGTITAESEPGVGSRFVIRLPRVP